MAPSHAHSKSKKSTRQISHAVKRGSLSGQEPGLDPLTTVFEGEDDADIKITVSDYDQNVFKSTLQSVETFQRVLEEDRPQYSSVRWIHCNGLSWKVLKLCALKFSLHSLALEDCLHQAPIRSKADYYKSHLFVNVAFFSVRSEDQDYSDSLYYEIGKDVEAGRRDADDSSPGESGDVKDLANFAVDAAKLTVSSLTNDFKVGIRPDVLSIFLLRDGTVITMSRHDMMDILQPIFERLSTADTVLRQSADGSMLLQALLDLTVDHLLQLSDTFQKQVTILEGKVIVNPEMSSVRQLHILSAELSQLKRSAIPLQNTIYNLRHYDGQKTHAAGGGGTLSVPPSPGVQNSPQMAFHPTGLLDASEGYLSRQARVYLSDVHDHIDEFLANCDQFSDICENLISYTFNMVNFNMQNSMEGLSLITVIFLPLSVLTGYFGMNFTKFGSLENTPAYFWSIGIPVCLATLLIFGWSYVSAVYRRFRRFNTERSSARRVKAMHRKDRKA